MFEFLATENSFLTFKLNGEQQRMQQNILELRELQYFSRYGDYLKILPSRVAKHHWTDISANIRREEEREKIARLNGDDSYVNHDVRMAVRIACHDLGVDEKIVFWAIHGYAERNQASHSDIETLKRLGDFQKLAKTFYADLHDLRCTFSSYYFEESNARLESLIKEELHWCFDMDDMDDPKSWVATRQLMEFYQAAKAALKKSTNGEQKEVSKEQAKTLVEAKKQRLIAASKGEDAKKGQKRMASTEVPRDSEAELKSKRVIMENLLRTQVKLETQLENVEKAVERMREES
ncbi:hypothetical protein MMC13_004826 [Lambiella insularis]|nr:hypothetical protein [Lambiella insularis]